MLLILCTAESGRAYQLDLSEGWRVRSGEHPPVETELSGSFQKHLPFQDGLAQLELSRQFLLEDRPKDGMSYLVIPSNWANLRVDINGYKVLDELQGPQALGRIFEHRIVPVSNSILTTDNSISLLAQGHVLRAGFRSSDLYLTDDSSRLARVQFRNILANEMHIAFIVLALIIGFIGFKLNKLSGTSTHAVRALAWTGLGLIPHHLLATDFYRLIGADESGPFKFQMLFQLAAWVNFILFINRFSQRNSSILEKLKSVWSRHVWTRYALLALGASAFFIPMIPFLLIVMPVFVTLCLASLFMTFSLRRDNYGILFFLGTLLCMTSLASDVLFADLYLLGYGTALFSIVGAVFFSANYQSSFFQGQAFNEIVARSLPRSVHNRIWTLVVAGRSLTEMRSAVSGNSLLAVVLIDICDWGKMNDIDHSRIPVGLLRQARTKSFAQFEKIMGDHGFDLLKTTGDNMTFVGGLFESVENKDVSLSAKTLAAVRDLLAEVDPINGELRRLNLPMIKVKISASMGACDYGLELYNERLQFDIQGHPVNTAYRIEGAMDASFYSQFGKNVCLISSTVVHPCEDLVLRKRFSESFKFSDKHGLEYECYVGRQYDQELRIEDFAQALFGLYGHVSAAKDQPHGELTSESEAIKDGDGDSESATAIAQKFAPRDAGLRKVRRQKLYVNDGLFVTIAHENKSSAGRAMDISGNGVAIAVPVNEALDLRENDTVVLNFNIDQQNVAVDAVVVNQSEFSSNGKDYKKFGCRFADHQRQAAERSSRRFPTLDGAPPIVSITDPLDHRRRIRFRCADISSSGLGLVTSSSESGLLPGLKLLLSVGIPGEATVDVEGEIRYVRPLPDLDSIHVGVHLDGDLEEFRTAAGAYLVAESEGQLSFREARLCGFLLGGVRKLIRVKYPDSAAEWAQINDLRQSLVGQDNEKGSDLSLVDTYDEHSRQIICVVGQRVVACSRIVFNDGQEGRIEHLSYGAKVPAWLLEKKFVECSRLIVHPEFRGDDVLWAMMEEIGRVTLTSGHRYIVQSCSRGLFPLYQRFGFEELSSFHDGGSEWVLNALDVEKGVVGKISGGLGWALVLSNLSETMQKRHQYRLGALDAARVRVFDTTRPVVLSRYRKHREKMLQQKERKADSSQQTLANQKKDLKTVG